MGKNKGKGDDFFGGFFDFDGDGNTDFFETMLGFKILEDITKTTTPRSSYSSSGVDLYDWRDYCEDGSEYGIDPYDYETEEEYEEALKEAKYGWRNDCDDGSEYGLYPEDYETEEEYEEALDEAKYGWQGDRMDGLEYGISPYCYETEEEYEEALEEAKEIFEETLNDLEPEKHTTQESDITISFSVEWPALDRLDAIKESDFPNKRRYQAAYTLANEFIAYCSEEVEKREKGRCKFIAYNADSIIAANYLTTDGEFLYAQAAKEHFALPIEPPHEDEYRETSLDELISGIAKKDIGLALKVWGWCLEQFFPYAKYEPNSEFDMTEEMFPMLFYCPEEFRRELLLYMEEHPGFAEKLLDTPKKIPDDISELIFAALKMNHISSAKKIFDCCIKKEKAKPDDLVSLVEEIICLCVDDDGLESIEIFRDELLSKIKNHSGLQAHIREWNEQIAEHIRDEEKYNDKYAFSRSNAWRKSCVDGSEYGIDPLDYETEEEYNEAIQEEKYGWRDWCSSEGKEFGIDVMDYETEEDFTEALNIVQKRQRKEYDSSKKQYSDPLAETDMTVYTFCGVSFGGNGIIYHYRTDDETLAVGDKVVVPVGNDRKEAVAEVITVQKHRRKTAPYPVDKAKFIIRRYIPSEGEVPSDS